MINLVAMQVQRMNKVKVTLLFTLSNYSHGVKILLVIKQYISHTVYTVPFSRQHTHTHHSAGFVASVGSSSSSVLRGSDCMAWKGVAIPPTGGLGDEGDGSEETGVEGRITPASAKSCNLYQLGVESLRSTEERGIQSSPRNLFAPNLSWSQTESQMARCFRSSLATEYC